jgi:hypothetical protein
MRIQDVPVGVLFKSPDNPGRLYVKISIRQAFCAPNKWEELEKCAALRLECPYGELFEVVKFTTNYDVEVVGE